MKYDNLICSKCGAVLSPEGAHEFEGKVFCGETVLCSSCGERIWRSDAEGDSTVTLCTDCYEERYTVCEGCGALVHNDNAYYEDNGDYPFCHDCFEKFNKSAIKNYSYKPEPIFYGSGNLFYEGEILKITSNGTTERSAFSYTDYCGRNWWDYGFYGDDYLTELKSVSSYYGYSPNDIDELAECGFTLEEIEEYLYCGGEV